MVLDRLFQYFLSKVDFRVGYLCRCGLFFMQCVKMKNVYKRLCVIDLVYKDELVYSIL